MKKYNIILLLFFILGSAAYAQKFTATVSSNTVSVGDRIQVTFSLENGGGSGFKAPGFKGFTVLGGPSQMHSTQIINGRMSSSESYTYVIQADVEGKFNIEPASINVNGKRVSSNPIQVSVVKGNAKQQNKPGAQGGQGGNNAPLEKQADEIISKNLFIRLNISRNNVYQGEQLTATYRLYVHPDLQIVNITNPKMPTFNGFWTNELEVKELKFDREVVNGINYKVADLKKVVLLPQQSGNLKIDPMAIDFVVRLAVQNQRRSRGFFDDFFDDPMFGGGGYRDFPFTAHSNAGSVTVKPLPGNTPAGFSGGVGSLKLNAWLDKTRTRTNEPVTLKVQISGTGNLKLIEPLDINLPPDIETYDPKTADNTIVSAAGISGNKTFEYLLIPRHTGEYKIQPVKFSYFDLNTKSYVTLTSNEFILNVDKGTGGEGGTIAGINKEDIQYLGKDIRFIKTSSAGLNGRGCGFFGSAFFYLFSIMPLFLFILFFIYQRKQQKLNEDQILLRNKRANRTARKRLTQAKNYMDNGRGDKFYEEVSRALWGYLSHKLGIPYSDLTKDSAAQQLTKKNVPPEITNKILSTIDDSEFARFAPSAGEAQNMKAIYNDAVTAITDMEGCLR